MEAHFGQQYRDRFDSFMRTYLTVRSGSIPREDEVYSAFKKHVMALPESAGEGAHRMESVATDLYEQAGFYARIAFAAEPDSDLRAAFPDLATPRAAPPCSSAWKTRTTRKSPSRLPPTPSST